MGKKKLQIKVSGAQSRALKDRKSHSDTKAKVFAPETLAEQLAKHHLRIAEISADGNCFFRAVADQLEVRASVTAQNLPARALIVCLMTTMRLLDGPACGTPQLFVTPAHRFACAVCRAQPATT